MTMEDVVAAVAEELWRADYADIAYEFASPCICSPYDTDCGCPAPTTEALKEAWQEVRVIYPPDVTKAAYLVEVVLRHAKGAA